VLTIDASVLVAAVLEDEAAHPESSRLLRALARSGAILHEPVIAIIEIVSAVVRRTGDRDLAQTAARHLMANPALIVHPLGLVEAARAAELAATYRLRAADAQYAAVALMNGCELVTLDAELIERAGPEVDACGPAEWLARQAS
jgi:predicted nucleic acid-binding protein